MKKSGLIILVLIVTAIIGLGFAGVKVSDFLARKTTGTIVGSTSKSSTYTDTDSSDSTVDIQTPDGTARFSSDNSLPPSFPSGVPTPTVGTITSSYTGTGGDQHSYTVGYSLTTSQAATAGADYKAQLEAAGFEILGSSSTSSNQDMIDILSATKGTITLSMTIAAGDDDTATLGLVVSAPASTD